MSERVFRDFQNSILTSFFRNFWRVRNRTNSEFSVNSECSETPVSELRKPNYVFRNSQKRKVRKIPSNAGPYLRTPMSPTPNLVTCCQIIDFKSYPNLLKKIFSDCFNLTFVRFNDKIKLN